MDEKRKCLEKTLVLLTEELANLATHITQQQQNLASISSEYIREVEFILNVKNRQIQDLERALKSSDDDKQ